MSLGTDRRALWGEFFAFAFVFALYASIAPQVAAGKVLFLGGDTTRDAWRASDFLRTWRFTHGTGAPYESGYFALLYVPFLLVFGNTITCLKIMSLTLPGAAVAVFYLYVRRTYGLTAALCLGSLFATAPALLAHLAVNGEFNIPLFIGIVMLLATGKDQRFKYSAMAAAGLFTSFNAYFLFPFVVYLLSMPEVLSTLPLRSAAMCFAVGAVSLFGKYIGTGPVGLAFGTFARRLLHTNIERWAHPGALFADLWTQWSWSVGSMTVYSRVLLPPHPSLLIVLWILLALGCVVVYRSSRKLLFAYVAGLLLIASLQSVSGLGLRHFLPVVMFQWLFMAPALARAKGIGRTCLLTAVALVTAGQYETARRSAVQQRPVGTRTMEDTRYVATLIEDQKGAPVVLTADNPNAFFSLKFLEPQAAISYFEVTGPVERHGLLKLSRKPGESSVRKNFLLSGVTVYKLTW